MEPFDIEGPAVISFSGGRTSAYMLRRMLDVGLRPDVHVLFANTGKERLETLDFVADCARTWNVDVHWLERSHGEVTVESASRQGEPFEALIHQRKFTPNPVARFCTQELKIRPMRDWMRARGYEHWTNVVGIRADEPRRVAKMRAATEARHEWDIAFPLADAGITERDVMAFWSMQSFDLQLQKHEGNCDLCFLKGPRKRQQIIRDRPDLAVWWIKQEQTIAPFRIDCPSYAALAAQGDLFHDDGALIECFCTD